MRNILVVDDSQSVRCSVKNILASVGLDVSEACDGKEGLEIATRSNFDLIITAVNMPEMDGFKLAELLRQTAAYKSTPIVFMTTETSDEIKITCLAAGATAGLTKPFSPSKLIESVGKVAGLW